MAYFGGTVITTHAAARISIVQYTSNRRPGRVRLASVHDRPSERATATLHRQEEHDHICLCVNLLHGQSTAHESILPVFPCPLDSNRPSPRRVLPSRVAGPSLRVPYPPPLIALKFLPATLTAVGVSSIPKPNIGSDRLGLIWLLTGSSLGMAAGAVEFSGGLDELPLSHLRC